MKHDRFPAFPRTTFPELHLVLDQIGHSLHTSGDPLPARRGGEHTELTIINRTTRPRSVRGRRRRCEVEDNGKGSDAPIKVPAR